MMKPETIQKAVEFGKKTPAYFRCNGGWQWTDASAAAGKISALSEDRLAVSAWFCPGTLENLNQNRKISLVVWDPDT
jgi:hypothetical protein